VRYFCFCLDVACPRLLLFTSFFPGQILYDANSKVIGIGTNDMGIAKDGSKKENFQRGVEIKGFHFTCFFLSDESRFSTRFFGVVFLLNIIL